MKNQLVRVKKTHTHTQIHMPELNFPFAHLTTKNHALGSLFGRPTRATLLYINEIGTAICFSFGSKTCCFLILTRNELLSLIHSMSKHI